MQAIESKLALFKQDSEANLITLAFFSNGWKGETNMDR